MTKDSLLAELQKQLRRLKSDVKKSHDKAFVMVDAPLWEESLKDQIYARKQALGMDRGSVNDWE